MVMRRAIAGIKSARKVRGQVIELEPEKKALLAVKDGLANSGLFPGKMAFGTEIEVDTLDFSMKGDKLKKQYENNNYKARGTLKLHLRDAASDTIAEPKKAKYVVEFCDCLDGQGIPDLGITSFNIT